MECLVFVKSVKTDSTRNNMPDSDFIATTDEKGNATLYFAENQVIEMKRISFLIGALIGCACGAGTVMILCLIV